MKPWFERNLVFGYPVDMLPFFLDRMEGTILRIEFRVKNLPDIIMSEKLDDKWSVKQNIGHLAEVDVVNNRRIDQILAGEAVMAPAVFEPMDYNPWQIEEVLNLFRKNRAANISKYRSLTEKELSMSSLHPRLKLPMTPVDLAWFDAEHDDHHLVRINEIIFTLTKK